MHVGKKKQRDCSRGDKNNGWIMNVIPIILNNEKERNRQASFRIKSYWLAHYEENYRQCFIALMTNVLVSIYFGTPLVLRNGDLAYNFLKLEWIPYVNTATQLKDQIANKEIRHN